MSRADGPAGAGSNGRSFVGAVSDDGRFVAFDSSGTNVSAVDDDTTADTFVRDVVAGTTTLVSQPTGTANPAMGGGAAPSISADGRLVAFQSQSDNLSADDGNLLLNLFVRDTLTNTTTLVSRGDGLAGPSGDESSFVPQLSGDGRFVVFESEANNLSTADVNTVRNIFVRDIVAGSTTLVSRADGAAGAGADAASSDAAISGDGRFVAFSSDANNLSAEDNDAVRNVFLRDMVAGTTTLVSRSQGATGAGGDASSENVTISRDGRWVGFGSGASNLSDADADPTPDVFVRDTLTAQTILVSRAAGPNGAGGDRESRFPSLSGDGRYVAFESEAQNLSDIDVDQTGVSNIFRRDLGDGSSPSAPAAGGGATPITTGTPAITARCAGVLATIAGTGRADVIRGTARRDVIAALGGDDVVRGLGGDDLICLGAGNDRGIGGAGADRILGGAGRDTLLGGPGIDRLVGSGGRDIARGGLGRDVCIVEAKLTC